VADGDVLSILPAVAGGARARPPRESRVRYDDVLGLIGETPLVGVHQLSPNPDVRIWAKLEGQNPGGSSKDRIALKMVELAERDGVLKPGATILEPSSGNTGIGLALVAKLRGYKLRVIMPENVSVERRQLLEIFGAEVTLSPGEEGSNGAIRMSEKIHADEPDRYVFLFQYGNPANPLAHYEGTGPEILRDCPEIDVFVAGLGTSGTLMGAGRFLKEQKPGVKVIAVEPPAGELVMGLRNLEDGFVPPIFDPELLDRKLIVRPRDSIEGTRRLLNECGVFAGISSGAAVAGAIKAAQQMERGTIVTLLPDGGWKYLSSGAWTDPIDDVVERATRINYW
jgi:cysteine synthase B